MLLTALCDYAKTRRLLDDLPLQTRTLHALIAIDESGKLRQDWLTPLSQSDAKGKEIPGLGYLLPRFPGENNGGKAYFLAEGSVAVFGRDKKSGSPIAAFGKNNSTKAFHHFWSQIEAALSVTNDPRLAAMLAYKQRYLVEHDGLTRFIADFVRMRPKDRGKKQGELEFVANTGSNDSDYIVIEKSTFGFSVNGIPVTLNDENDVLREYWFKQYASQAFSDEPDDEPNDTAGNESARKDTLCLVTGETGIAIARSHKPKILGVPGIAAGGYVVSFARAAPAFSSYGFQMGENSPVSETAAASYALALMELLRDEETHINLGPIAVCSWAKQSPKIGGQMTRMMAKANPVEIAKFLKTPYSGSSDREIINRDRLYTVALTGNAGRVVIVHWLDQTVADAIEHFQQWWDDLQIAPMFSESASSKKKAAKTTTADPPPSPFAISGLARATLRESKKQKADKLVGERIVQLFRAALEGTAPPITLLKPILDEFQSALVKDDASKPTFPFNQSRFALIKLILVRFFRNKTMRKETDFMPLPQLADTPEPAYNLGRLLAVFEGLQDRYHNFEKKGAGVIERYYGTASSAPAAVFPLLCRLARHHLSKVRKEDESAANRIDSEIGEILKKFQPDQPGESPKFKRILTLPEQGIFALGFYQQRAYSKACAMVLSNLGKARELRGKDKPYDEPLTKSRQFAAEFKYQDLIDAVEEFETKQ